MSLEQFELNIMRESRLGAGVGMREIPQKYRQYPVLGKGSTSVILDKGDGTVLVFTRDTMKGEYIRDALGAKYIEEYESYNPVHSKTSKFPIRVYQMKKFEPIPTGKKRALMKILNKFEEILRASYITSWKIGNTDRRPKHFSERVNAARDWVEEQPFPEETKNSLNDFLDWVGNYDERQFILDLHSGNIMQDQNGHLVLVDPVVDKEFHDILQKSVAANRSIRDRW